jgi:hypothetical protein
MNKEQCITNLNIRGTNTRYGSDIHQTISDLSVYQRGSYQKRLKVLIDCPLM